MKLTKFSKKLIAYLCAIAMVVSSFAFTPATDVNAAQSETIDGITYTITDGAQGDWTGIVTQGIFDKARIHWAWGKEVNPASIAITVDGKELTPLGASANGVHVTVANVKETVESQMGDYTIQITAVSTDSEQLMWTADLKMEEAGPTTSKDPSVVTWVDILASDGLQYDDNTTVSVVSYQEPGWPGIAGPGVYFTQPAGAGAPMTVTIDGVTTNISGDKDYGTFYAMGAGLLVYGSTLTNEITTIDIHYAPNADATLRIKNTKVEPTTEAPTVEPTTETPTEEPTTEEPTQEPTTEAPTEKPVYPYDTWVNTERNLALLGTPSDTGEHREGAVEYLNDGEVYSWDGRDGITVDAQHPSGSFDIALDKAYDAASIDQIAVYWRCADANFYPSSYQIQFGYKGTFKTVATVSGSDSSGEIVPGWPGDEGRYVTDKDFTSARLDSAPVDTVRILVSVPVQYGCQAREVAVFAENPKDAPEQPQADSPAAITANSPDYGQIAYNVTAGEGQDAYKYNVYANDTLIGEGVNAGQDYIAYGFAPGEYSVKAVSIVEGMDPSDPVFADAVTVADPIELFGSPKNKAPNGLITDVSSFYNADYDLATSQCAIDGTPQAGEGNTVCCRTGDHQEASIDIDLGQAYNVKDLQKILIAYTNPRTYASNTMVGISSDGINYDLAAESEGFIPTKDGQLSVNVIDPQIADSEGTFQYVRIILSGGANDYGYCINQIGVIVDDGEEPSTEPTSEQPSTEPGGLVPDTDITTDGWTTFGGYGVYVGTTWAVTAVKVGLDPEDSDHMVFENTEIGGQWNNAWGSQVDKHFPDLDTTKTYTIEWPIKAASGTGHFEATGGYAADFNGDVQIVTGKLEVKEEQTDLSFTLGFGYAGLNNVVEIFQPTVKDSEGNVVYPKTEPTSESPTVEPSTEPTSESPTVEPSTEPTSETPSVEPSTEPTSESPTVEPSTEAPTETQAPTQKPTQAPTVKPTDETPVPIIKIPDKVSVKKAIKKKKSAKKIKVKLKKQKGAKGYQIAVYKTKKNAKKNKKALVKKYTTKIKLTIKSKKFKKKKKLYVRARAYTLDGTVKVFGPWSKVKKTTKK